MPEPSTLRQTLLRRLAQFEPGSREHRIRTRLLDAHENSQHCRQTVLSHREAARKLCEYPLEYAQPEQWNGFIPPEIFAEKHNDSPRRAALITLLGEAMETP